MVLSKQSNNRTECVNVILNFLAWNNYNPCSVKELLKSPSLDVLLNIWNFLFKLVDPKINITQENMAKEVPKFYNDFGYPHAIRKSQLKFPPTFQQWDTNLVALSWLCKLLMYEHENFDKELEKTSEPRKSDSSAVNIASTLNLRNSLTSEIMTELTNKHFKYYLNQEETAREVANDVETKLNRVLSKLESSVESKENQLEKLRTNSMELQKQIQEFEKLRDRVNTLFEDVSKIEQLTEAMKNEFMKSQRELDVLNDTLSQETNSLMRIENKNKEINEIMRTTVDGNDIKDLNMAINELKMSLSNSVKKIKELECELPSLTSNVTNMRHDLAKTHASVLKSCQVIMNCLSSKGMDVSSWKKLDELLKSVDLNSLENLSSLTEDCSRVVEDVVVDETFNFKNESEFKSQHTEALSELENTEKSLKEEIAELRSTESEHFKSTQFLNEKSHILSHTDLMVSMIKSNAKDEMDATKHELETATNELKLANKRLEDERFNARSTLQKYVETMKEIVERTEEYKLKNTNVLKELISFQKKSTEDMKML